MKKLFKVFNLIQKLIYNAILFLGAPSNIRFFVFLFVLLLCLEFSTFGVSFTTVGFAICISFIFTFLHRLDTIWKILKNK